METAGVAEIIWTSPNAGPPIDAISSVVVSGNVAMLFPAARYTTTMERLLRDFLGAGQTEMVLRRHWFPGIYDPTGQMRVLNVATNAPVPFQILTQIVTFECGITCMLSEVGCGIATYTTFEGIEEALD